MGAVFIVFVLELLLFAAKTAVVAGAAAGLLWFARRLFFEK